MKKIIIVAAFFITNVAIGQKKKWVNIFDGKTTKGWHTWKETGVKGWHVMGGDLMSHGGNGDLVTDKEYGDFILEFEFKASPKGNSGLIYKVIEDPSNKALSATYSSGPEYQIIDDLNYPSEINNRQKTGANYDIDVPNDLTAVKPAGEWNKGKIMIKDNIITHFLNGKKVVTYSYGTPEWDAAVAKSKFATMPYAKAHARGKIALQDHGDMVTFRKMRIKEL